MANFPRQKPNGWAKNEILKSEHLTNIDINVSKSVNGEDGGEYAGDLIWTGEHTHHGPVTHEGAVTFGADATWSEDNYPKITQRDLTVILPLAAANAKHDAWSFTPALFTWSQKDVVSPFNPVVVPLIAPRHSKIMSIHVRIFISSAHVGLPENQPVVSVWKRDIAGVVSNMAGTTMEAHDLSAYEKPHNIAVDLGEDGLFVDGATEFFVAINGENGTNALAEMVSITAAHAIVQCDKIAP